jgi:UDP-N-acetylmuramate--alanine ligase
LKQAQHMHFMGIGGQGISAVAQMARLAGNIVTGCDQQSSATVRALQCAGIAIEQGHSAEHLKGVDMLVISPAIPALNPHNPELLAAQERGLRVVTWQEVLGELMRGKCVLSVSGVHGKGTTTALLALALVDAGLDPTCEIGAVVPRFGANYRLGKSQYFVNEADEFNHNFWHYHPRLAIVTAIEFEHPEFFADYEAFLNAFVHFIRGMDMSGNWPLAPMLIINQDSPGCLDLCDRLGDWPGQIVAYSVEQPAGKSGAKAAARHIERRYTASFQAYDVQLEGETSFRIRVNGDEQLLQGQPVRLQLPGLYNIQNSLAAFVAAYTLGVDAASIARTLADFGGNRRRFEIRYIGPLKLEGQERQDVMLVDDYAHHPTAISATLEAARQRYPGRRLVAVYQPHMFSRTKAFFAQFMQAFDEADVVIIADIFPAREHDDGSISARDLVAHVALRPRFLSEVGANVMHGGSIEATTQQLRKTLHSGDLVVIMGAGDIYIVTERLLEEGTQ